MNVLTRPPAPRSERDELESRQGELREARRQRETLPREHAERKEQVARLEEEVSGLRRTLARARREWEQPVPSLPDQLEVPFQASSSRQTAYGRIRFALQALLPALVLGACCNNALVAPPSAYDSGLVESLSRSVGLLLLLSVGFGLRLAFHGNEDDAELPSWSFDTEGFSRVAGPWEGYTVRYAQVESVEVVQDWLQRLCGFGTVRVTFRPDPSTPRSFPNSGRFDLELLDDPERLATWLRQQVAAAHEKGGAHAR